MTSVDRKEEFKNTKLNNNHVDKMEDRIQKKRERRIAQKRVTRCRKNKDRKEFDEFNLNTLPCDAIIFVDDIKVEGEYKNDIFSHAIRLQHGPIGTVLPMFLNLITNGTKPTLKKIEHQGDQYVLIHITPNIIKESERNHLATLLYEDISGAEPDSYIIRGPALIGQVLERPDNPKNPKKGPPLLTIQSSPGLQQKVKDIRNYLTSRPSPFSESDVFVTYCKEKGLNHIQNKMKESLSQYSEKMYPIRMHAMNDITLYVNMLTTEQKKEFETICNQKRKEAEEEEEKFKSEFCTKKPKLPTIIPTVTEYYIQQNLDRVDPKNKIATRNTLAVEYEGLSAQKKNEIVNQFNECKNRTEKAMVDYKKQLRKFHRNGSFTKSRRTYLPFPSRIDAQKPSSDDVTMN